MDNLRTGLLKQQEEKDISYLKGKLDPEYVLESLGLEIGNRVGGWIMCNCPNPANHTSGDSSPSFGYNHDKMWANCFVCGGWSLLELVKLVLGTDDDGAEEWLIEHTTLVPSNSGLVEELQKFNQEDEDGLSEYPPNLLFKYRKIHPYLYERGLTKDVIVKYQVGYDEKHDAIMIPHFFLGRLIGYQRRHLSSCEICVDKKGRTPKYKSSHKFPKNTLYGYDEAIRYIKETGDKMIVVESPMSKLKLESLGYPNSAATFGSFNYEQMIPLFACQNGVILWPDNDPAGNTNINRVIRFLTKVVPVQVAPVVGEYGEKGDAADLAQPSQIQEYLEAAYSPFVFIRNGLLNIEDYNIMMQKFGTPEKLSVVSDEEKEVIEEHKARTGKRIQDLDDQERESLHKDLDEHNS